MPAASPPPLAVRPTLTRQRCWNHAEREAAARCPTCERFYCRECVTEHAGRMVCATCLRAELAAASGKPRTEEGAWRAAGLAGWQVAQVAAGVAAAWFFFHLVAQKLISLPEKFHDGTFWTQTFQGEQNGDE